MAICKICKTPLFEYEVRDHWRKAHRETYFKVIQSLVPVEEKEVVASRAVREIQREPLRGTKHVSVDAKIRLNERYFSKI